jgi:hypothetical protein
MFQNVVIGMPLCEPHLLFASDKEDWEKNEKPITLFTEDRFLPRVLVAAGIAKSANEVRKNRPELVKELTEVNFIKLKWGKKFLWIAVGE